MPALGSVMGALLGMGLGGYLGAIAGGLIGYLLGSLFALQARVERLEAEIERSTPHVPRESTPADVPRGAERKATPAPPEPEPVVPERSVPPPRLSAPAPSETRDVAERLWRWARPFLSGSSFIVTVGVVVVFFGCAFLLKYAVERGLVPIELRLGAAALGGCALVALGFWTRRARPGFGLSLQGGGLGILYLTVFAAFRLYALLPPGAAFTILGGFVVASALLAVTQDALALAALASVGGFLAPVLTSTGEGSHVALFTYYLLLNAGIVAMAWFKSFRALNLLGFVFTFVISTSWGLQYYRPAYFTTTEPFLVLFVLLYVTIAVLFALRQPPRLRGLVDGTIVFGVPLAATVLQTGLVRDAPYGLAWSAAVAGAFYIALATALKKLRPGVFRPLAEAFLATGLVFATLAIPFTFDDLVTSVLWALEGSAIVWVGARQQRRLARLSGGALQLLAAVAFSLDPGSPGARAVLNGRYLGAVLVALAAVLTALCLHRARSRVAAVERLLGPAFFAWGVAWWLFAGLSEIGAHVTREDEVAGWVLLFFAATAVLALYAGRRLRFPALAGLALGLLPALLMPLALSSTLDHPFQGLAFIGWLAALGAEVFVLRAQPEPSVPRLDLWHAGGLWLVALLGAWEASELVEHAFPTGSWGELMWPLAPLLLMLALLLRGEALVRPLRGRVEAYLGLGLAPLAVGLFLWTLDSSLHAWDPSPLPYWPVSSPIDVTVLLVLATLVLWSRRASRFLERHGARPGGIAWLAAAGVFWWAHGVVARTAHFYAGVPFAPRALFDSDLVQTAVAVLWALVGLVSMVTGTRRGMRSLWTAGAVLMGAVVLKLFLVDLSSTGTLERIVSFLGVGALLLVVGYFSPVPPRDQGPEAAA